MIAVVTPYQLVALWFVIVGLVLAAFLLIWPNAFLAANRFLKKWISTDSLERKLNQTHDIDKHLMRWRKVIGIIFVVLAAIFMVLLLR